MPIRVTREASAQWRGSVPTGEGTLALGSGAFTGPYSLRSRTQETPHTNPEEMIGAAHAGCFSMALASLLDDAGHSPERIDTDARVLLQEGDGGFSITRIALRCRGVVPGLDADRFSQLAGQAKDTCPVSRALAGVEIELDAALDG